MRYGSVCSGIEAATVAWHALGWTPAWFSEIEPFPCAVLAHHYPTVPNLGDMTRIGKDAGPIDLLVGGTPCQSFSVAGLRKGLADPRGNLALVFLRLVDELRPRWVVWENVPGVLSSGGGRDFGSFLGGLVELGYGFAYRVLDAQYVRTHGHPYAVPQRRRRVFVVGHLGDWRRAGAVLLERESLRGDSPPRREAGASVAPCFTPGAHPGSYNGQDAYSGGLIANTIDAHMGGGGPDDNAAQANHLIPMAFDWQSGGDSRGLDPRDMAQLQRCQVPAVCHTLKAEGFDAGEDGTGRGTPIVPVAAIAFDYGQSGADKATECASVEHSPPLIRARSPAVAFAIQERAHATGTSGPDGAGFREGVAYTLEARHRPQNVATMTVRRLTPLECERLQGFHDGYTAVPFRGKPATDGPRYRALGNSMAANVMAWIGARIAQVEAA